MANEEYFAADSTTPLDPPERAARVASVKDGLEILLRDLDQLGLSRAGAHVSMALHAIETDG